jgi:putative nucleotidyltransferase with HDIG domain
MTGILLTDVVMGLSSAIDLVSPQMADHHKRVAYIAYNISSEMGLSHIDKKNILMAGLLHDCGAIQDEEKLRAFRFDFGETMSVRMEHGIKGWNILSRIDDLKYASQIIKYHHLYWNEAGILKDDGEDIPLGSYILHLADRVDVLTDRTDEVLQQRETIRGIIRKGSGTMFMPDAADAFLRLSEREYFWFDLISPYMEDLLKDMMKYDRTAVGMEKMLTIARTFTGIIDYRSKFTADHSIGVAECASQLSQKMGYSKSDVRIMKIAGLLHDLGKLAIPIEILEKDGPLDRREFNIMKKHTFYSYRILGKIKGLEEVNEYASFHHERLDGSGYPFKLDGGSLSMGARIMAVSDVFTALTEKRPYRNAMSVNEAIKIMNSMVANNHIDGDVVNVLRLHADEINEMKQQAQYVKVPAFSS